MTRVSLFLDYLSPIFTGVSTLSHVSTCDSTSVRLNRDHPMSLKEAMAHDYACAIDENLVDHDPLNRRTIFDVF